MRSKIFIAAVGGLLLSLSFPKAGLDFLAWIALVPLLWVIRDQSVKDAFKLGMAFGMAHFLSLVYWLYHVMAFYGGLPWIAALPLLVLLCVYLAMYPAGFAALCRWCAPRPWLLILAAPAAWVGLEYLRMFLVTGFPWCLAGVSQYQNLALIQMADFSGVFGISALIVLVNTAFFLAVAAGLKKSWDGKTVGLFPAAAAVALAALCLALALAYGQGRLDRVAREVEKAPEIKVAVLQGNVDQSIKWDPAFQLSTVRLYVDLVKEAQKDEPELIVWPETSLPFFYSMERVMTDEVDEAVRESGAHHLLASPSYVRRADGGSYLNSAFLTAPDASPLGRYDKVHLVPWGEYVPLKTLFPFIRKLVQAVGDFDAGQAGNVLEWEKGGLGTLICYEVVFPGLSRAMARNKANLLVTITNDAWFGRTSAPYQHFAMAVFRCVETRRALARAANTGISGFVGPSGRVLASTQLMTRAQLSMDLPLMSGQTFYNENGDLFTWLLIVALFFLVLWGFYLRR